MNSIFLILVLLWSSPQQDIEGILLSELNSALNQDDVKGATWNKIEKYVKDGAQRMMNEDRTTDEDIALAKNNLSKIVRGLKAVHQSQQESTNQESTQKINNNKWRSQFTLCPLWPFC